jgi:hypothetical protein
MVEWIKHAAALSLTLLSLAPARAAAPAAPIDRVEVGRNAELLVNGKPFLPLMLWLQSEARIPDGLSIGVNTFTGNGGDLSSQQYLKALGASGLYGVLHYDERVIGDPRLLGWIHGDEPDLPQNVSDAEIAPGQGLRLNSKTPLSRIVDGVTHSWSVLDPLQDAEITIVLKKPAVIRNLAVWLTISQGLAVAKEVSFRADGQEILRTTLRNEKGEQKFSLEKPIPLKSLSIRVLSTYPGEQEWGSIGEIGGYDEQGANVLLSPPRVVPRSTVEEVAGEYRKIKGGDPTRPVFVTFTAHFMREFDRFDQAAKQRLYPEYVKSCDVAGFDVYPIFGWNKPEWLYRVADGVSELRSIAGPRRPLYAWIETNKGSRWVSAERQIDVKPADTRAEVWMALIRGATAIGYFTHRWTPNYKQFAPEGEMVAELKRLNEQLTRLAPAILAGPADVKVGMTMSGGLPCHFKATRLEPDLYIFAQNIDMGRNAATAAISIDRLQAGRKIEVMDEARTITAEDGRFSDRFEALAEHVYRVRL